MRSAVSLFAHACALTLLANCAPSDHVPNAKPTTASRDDASPSASPAASGELSAAQTRAAAASDAASPSPAASTAAPAYEPSSRESTLAWMKERAQSGDEVVDGPDGIGILHPIARGEIPATLAHAYLGLSDVYFEDDFATEIARSARKEGGFRAGNKIHVPHLVTEPFKSANDERIGTPDDKVVKGLYIRGATATKPFFVFILDQMAKRDINSIVLDAKDYDGPVTYRSKAPLAVETGAAKGAPIHDLSRVIRFVHKKGIRVVMRVS
jgi:hypothetical protein